MNPSQFAYERAGSVDEAIALLQEHGDGAKLIAGGHSLLPIMKLRLAEPETLIDIGRIPELRGVRRDDGEIAIGALTTHHQIATDAQIRSAVPLLADTAARVGDRQVRNRGTIGGALAHADAAADYPAAILALDATIVARGPQGERRIPAREFFLDFLTTALQPDEVLTEVRASVPAEGHGWSYQKLANQASGYAIVGVGVIVVVGRRRRLCRHSRRCHGNGGGRLARRGDGGGAARTTAGNRGGRGGGRSGRWRDRRPRRPPRLCRIPASRHARPHSPRDPGGGRTGTAGVGLRSVRPRQPQHVLGQIAQYQVV